MAVSMAVASPSPPAAARAAPRGCGRTAASEAEAPNMLAILRYKVADWQYKVSDYGIKWVSGNASDP
jgi:hypothetical protein